MLKELNKKQKIYILEQLAEKYIEDNFKFISSIDTVNIVKEPITSFFRVSCTFSYKNKLTGSCFLTLIMDEEKEKVICIRDEFEIKRDRAIYEGNILRKLVMEVKLLNEYK